MWSTLNLYLEVEEKLTNYKPMLTLHFLIPYTTNPYFFLIATHSSIGFFQETSMIELFVRDEFATSKAFNESWKRAGACPTTKNVGARSLSNKYLFLMQQHFHKTQKSTIWFNILLDPFKWIKPLRKEITCHKSSIPQLLGMFSLKQAMKKSFVLKHTHMVCSFIGHK